METRAKELSKGMGVVKQLYAAVEGLILNYKNVDVCVYIYIQYTFVYECIIRDLVVFWTMVT